MFPRLASRAVLAVLFAAPAFAADSGYSLTEKPGEALDVLRGGKVLARYMIAHDVSTPQRQNETYKPFLHVFDPAGQAPITKGAGGSFTHHRGIYIGWMKIGVGGQSFDRWHMKGGDQVHEKFLTREAGGDRATFTSFVRWQGAKPDETIIEEERTLAFLPPPAPAYALIDMTSKIKAVAGETTLDGDPEHAGLHFRPADDVDKTAGEYLYPVENANPHKDRDYPWFAESYLLRGQRYSVVYLNHPANPKEAAVSAYRDYGRFGAFWKAKVPAGGTAEFKARFVVIAGEMPSAEFCQKAWNDYAGKNEPTPKSTRKPAEISKPPAPKNPAATPAPKPAAPKSAAVREHSRALCAPNPAAPAEKRKGKPAAAATPAPTAKTDAPAPAPAGAKNAAPPDSDPNKSPVAVLSSDPAIAAAQSKKRAGGGPTEPVLHFRPPAPPVLTPQELLKTFKIEKGFKVELVASEPMVQAPVAASWDDQGRMYVCEMRGYMHDVDGTGEDQPLGRISRLEDTDGDGVMDKSTVFVDQLVMPRTVMALGDGAVINEPPVLAWYRDTDGDGVADKKEVINEQYAKAGGQPEHMANSPTWLMDNTITSAGHPVRFRFAQGRFTDEPTVAAGQWGLTQDDFGRPYFNSNSDLLRSHLVNPAYYLRNQRLPDRTGILFQVMKIQTCWPAGPTPGVNRGYLEDTTKPDGTIAKGTLRPDGSLQNVTATCGPTIYRGQLFPAEYRGNAFIPEPSGNLVKRLVLADQDGVLSARNAAEGREFLTSTDERFRPVNAYTGPDGALYLVDMARGVIQHKGFLTYYLVANIKDRKLEQPVNLGRIWRIVPVGARPKATRLPQESAKIAPLLANGNGWVRDTAQRVLVERGDTSVAPAVADLAAKNKAPHVRVQALWTLQGLNAVTPEVLTAAFKDAHPKVRAAAVEIAGDAQLEQLLSLAKDPSPEVRLHAAFKLSARTEPGVEPALIGLLRTATGPLFAEAIVSGLAGRELEFLKALHGHTDAADTKLAASAIFETLAGAILKERKGPRLAELLEIVASEPVGSPRQNALLAGLTGKAMKAPPKGMPVTYINLPKEPQAFLALASEAKLKGTIGKIEKQLAWPGKAGLVQKKVLPLTAEEKALYERGRPIYAAICGACHQPNGQGMPGLAPQLANSEWVLGPADRAIRIVLGGLTGPIEVGGTRWQLEMPGLPILSDEDVAGVLTFIRREWENEDTAVTPKQVAEVRAATQSRTKPWTAGELLKPLPVRSAKK